MPAVPNNPAPAPTGRPGLDKVVLSLRRLGSRRGAAARPLPLSSGIAPGRDGSDRRTGPPAKTA